MNDWEGSGIIRTEGEANLDMTEGVLLSDGGGPGDDRHITVGRPFKLGNSSLGYMWPHT